MKKILVKMANIEKRKEKLLEKESDYQDSLIELKKYFEIVSNIEDDIIKEKLPKLIEREKRIGKLFFQRREENKRLLELFGETITLKTK